MAYVPFSTNLGIANVYGTDNSTTNDKRRIRSFVVDGTYYAGYHTSDEAYGTVLQPMTELYSFWPGKTEEVWTYLPKGIILEHDLVRAFRHTVDGVPYDAYNGSNDDNGHGSIKQGSMSVIFNGAYLIPAEDSYPVIDQLKTSPTGYDERIYVFLKNIKCKVLKSFTVGANINNCYYGTSEVQKNTNPIEYGVVTTTPLKLAYYTDSEISVTITDIQLSYYTSIYSTDVCWHIDRAILQVSVNSKPAERIVIDAGNISSLFNDDSGHCLMINSVAKLSPAYGSSIIPVIDRTKEEYTIPTSISTNDTGITGIAFTRRFIHSVSEPSATRCEIYSTDLGEYSGHKLYYNAAVQFYSMSLEPSGGVAAELSKTGYTLDEIWTAVVNNDDLSTYIEPERYSSDLQSIAFRYPLSEDFNTTGVWDHLTIYFQVFSDRSVTESYHSSKVYTVTLPAGMEMDFDKQNHCYVWQSNGELVYCVPNILQWYDVNGTTYTGSNFYDPTTDKEESTLYPCITSVQYHIVDNADNGGPLPTGFPFVHVLPPIDLSPSKCADFHAYCSAHKQADKTLDTKYTYIPLKYHTDATTPGAQVFYRKLNVNNSSSAPNTYAVYNPEVCLYIIRDYSTTDPKSDTVEFKYDWISSLQEFYTSCRLLQIVLTKIAGEPLDNSWDYTMNLLREVGLFRRKYVASGLIPTTVDTNKLAKSITSLLQIEPTLQADKSVFVTPMEYYSAENLSHITYSESGEAACQLPISEKALSQEPVYFWVETLKNWCTYTYKGKETTNSDAKGMLTLNIWNGATEFIELEGLLNNVRNTPLTKTVEDYNALKPEERRKQIAYTLVRGKQIPFPFERLKQINIERYQTGSHGYVRKKWYEKVGHFFGNMWRNTIRPVWNGLVDICKIIIVDSPIGLLVQGCMGYNVWDELTGDIGEFYGDLWDLGAGFIMETFYEFWVDVSRFFVDWDIFNQGEEINALWMLMHGVVINYDEGYSSNDPETFQTLRFTYNCGRHIENGSYRKWSQISDYIGVPCIYRLPTGELMLATVMMVSGSIQSADFDKNRDGITANYADFANKILQKQFGKGENKTVDDFCNTFGSFDDFAAVTDFSNNNGTLSDSAEQHSNVNTELTGTIKITANRTSCTSDVTDSSINTLTKW